MISNSRGAFGKSRLQIPVQPQPVLSEEGIAKASRNRTIFNRAMMLLEREFSMSREDVLNMLSNDSDPLWTNPPQEFTD